MTEGPAARANPFGTGWLFGRAAPGSSLPGFDDSGFAAVTLPHTVTPLSWQGWKPAAWERVWAYRKHFDAPAGAGPAGRRVFLDIGAAMTQATVTLNGTEVGAHLGGYLPFSVELTGLLQPAGNVLAVRLDLAFNLNVPPGGPGRKGSRSVDFWQPGGMYRDAALRVVPEVFLAGLYAKPVNVLAAAARQVVVQATVDAAAACGAQVLVELRDGDRVLAGGRENVTITGPGQVTVTVPLSGLGEVTLWDTGRPQLYHVVARLLVDGVPVHEDRTRIGFREATFTAGGFYLNGQRTKLFGVNRHQFFPFAAGAMPARVQARDAQIIRHELNCNMVRCSHYPQSGAFLDACDELGLMVFQEAPGWGYLGDEAWRALAYRDVGQMIMRDRNRPSVVLWGARLNETGNDTALYTATNELAHALDDSRPTAGAMAGMRLTTDYQQDVFAANDYSTVRGPAGARQPSLQPPENGTGRPYLVTEAVGTLSGPARYYRRTDPQAVQQGQATAHARVHAIAAADDRYCGVLAWSGFDYPSGRGNQYRGVKYTGVVDLFRELKPGAAIYRAQVDPRVRPVIAPAFYWDFGAASPVTSLPRAMICANTDRLELYVGGSHFASLRPEAGDYGALAYPPSFADFRGVDGASRPDLRIDGYLGPDLVASRSLASDPSFDRLALAFDDAGIAGDGSDATRLVFRAADRYGAPRPFVTGRLTLSVAGPAVLLGDNPFDLAATGGAGAVWIRSQPGTAGTVTVSASHPVLGQASAVLRVWPAAG